LIRFAPRKGEVMNSIVYLVGAIVIIAAVLSFFGLR
jgi:predicted membrane channel-forming protein YqfA (hemolysin III family)